MARVRSAPQETFNLRGRAHPSGGCGFRVVWVPLCSCSSTPVAAAVALTALMAAGGPVKLIWFQGSALVIRTMRSSFRVYCPGAEQNRRVWRPVRMMRRPAGRAGEPAPRRLQTAGRRFHWWSVIRPTGSRRTGPGYWNLALVANFAKEQIGGGRRERRRRNSQQAGRAGAGEMICRPLRTATPFGPARPR